MAKMPFLTIRIKLCVVINQINLASFLFNIDEKQNDQNGSFFVIFF